jgi:tRNA CCA-adding enzyme
MNINLDEFYIEKKEFNNLSKKANSFKREIEKELRKNKIKADVFLGGSFAKKTLVNTEIKDIDIYVRFYEITQNNLKKLDKVVNSISKTRKLKINKTHGSRDYYRVIEEDIIYEIIPVLKINKPTNAQNVTDLSYFHVRYVKKKITPKLVKEIIRAKAFFKAQGVYGAETYIRGFSGYSVECLIIYYKTMDKMLKEILKATDKIILDPEKYYKNKNEILLNLNEGRLQSPIIIVDPVWGERNVTAALSKESLDKLRKSATRYLNNPSYDFFKKKEFNHSNFIKKSQDIGGEYSKLLVFTDKQEGDIAGTKLKKFFDFFLKQVANNFEIIQEEFVYYGTKGAEYHIVTKRKEKIIRMGPSLNMSEACIEFKKAHRNIKNDGERLFAEIDNFNSFKDFMSYFKQKYSGAIKGMNITELTLT